MAPELAWIGGRRGLEAELVPPSGIPLRRLLLRSLRSSGRDVHVVLDPLRLAASVPQALWALLRRRPAAVFTTGGYVAIPVLVAAGILRIPVVLWDGNVVPGRSVRATARLADAIAVTDPRTCEALAARRCYRTGTPIRDPRTVDREAAREDLGFGTRDRLLLVFGGSQAVRRFNTAVTDALPDLVERCAVLHVTGDDGYAAALAARDGLPAERQARYRPVPFLADDMTAALAAADMVVGRAGSSTLAECAAFGLPLICVPYPHAAGHQRANAEAYAATGAARLVDDADFDAARAARRQPPPRRSRRPPRHERGGPGAGPSGRGGRGRGPGRGGRGPPAVARAGGGGRDRVRDRGPLMEGPATAPFDAVAAGSEIQRRLGIKTSRAEPLARFTTMRVGGPADLYAAVHNLFELRAILKLARARAIPHTVLGRGSDVVISDAGVRGLLIHVRAEGYEIADERLVAEAGLGDGQGRHRDGGCRAVGARVRAGDPRQRRRRGLGQCRGP